jgi:hypothetical protein
MDSRIKPSGLLAPDYDRHIAPPHLIASKHKNTSEKFCWLTDVYYDYLLTNAL